MGTIYGKDEYEEAKHFGKRLALKHIGWIEDAMSDYKENATNDLTTLRTENERLRAFVRKVAEVYEHANNDFDAVFGLGELATEARELLSSEPQAKTEGSDES